MRPDWDVSVYVEIYILWIACKDNSTKYLLHMIRTVTYADRLIPAYRNYAGICFSTHEPVYYDRCLKQLLTDTQVIWLYLWRSTKACSNTELDTDTCTCTCTPYCTYKFRTSIMYCNSIRTMQSTCACQFDSLLHITLRRAKKLRLEAARQKPILEILNQCLIMIRKLSRYKYYHIGDKYHHIGDKHKNA